MPTKNPWYQRWLPMMGLAITVFLHAMTFAGWAYVAEHRIAALEKVSAQDRLTKMETHLQYLVEEMKEIKIILKGKN